MCTYFLPCCLHKVQYSLTGVFLEGGDILSCIYVVIQGVSEVGYIVWI